MRQSLKGKIIIPTVLVLALLVIIQIVFSSIRFSNFTHTLFYDKLNLTANALQYYLNDCKRASRAAAVSVSANAEVIKAVRDRDTDEIIRILTPTLDLYNVDFFNATDETGTVLARTHNPDYFGDSLLDQKNVSDALHGRVTTYYEEGLVSKVSIRTGSPVYDIDGTLIGTISTGVRLDTDETVDELKKHYNADFTVFYGDVRIATTVTSGGERITGTRLNPDIAKIVIGDKKEYYGYVEIQGEDYSAFYMPLLNAQNEVFAILFTGHSVAHLLAEEIAIIISGILIGFLALVISVIALLFIISKSIKPVKQLAYVVSEVTQGNVNICTDKSHVTKDEIGGLILDTYTLIDVIKSMMADLSQLTHKLSIYSDMDFQIDTSKYSGSYREIIDNIKILADSISMMKKTMAVADYLDTMISVTDFDYTLLYVNRSMAETYGIDRESCIGEKCYKAIRNFDEPCSICQLPNLMSEIEKGLYPSLDYEQVWDEVSGAWIGGRAAVMRWVDGGKVFFNSINDETARMKQKEQLRDAVDLAEAASAAKSAFLANMSHELRTPLNVIVGLSGLQLENDNLPEDMRENLCKISNAGNILLSIVNDILDISKIESGNFTLSPVEYHMASVLNDTVILNTSRINEKPVVFHLDISENLPSKLYGDDLRVRQILNNLLSNAIKYTNEGTIVLSIHCVREGDSDVWMEIAVKDTGIGIRPENIEKLFSDYNQVDALANRKVEGTGLGLSITRKLAESMGGTISVESAYGMGSTFRVRIRQGYVNNTPIGPEVAEDLRRSRYNDNKRNIAGSFAREDLSYAKVLVVDDLQTNLDVAAGLMRKYKMRVDCVTSGQAAIDRIRLGDPVYNAIFMDHMMPEMDGIEAADRIRALGGSYAQKIPIIALTANAVTGTEKLFYEHGFQAFLSKPINIMELDSVILQWVKHRAFGKPLRVLPEEPDISYTQALSLQGDHAADINIPGVNSEKGLSFCDGDQGIYLSVLRSYVADVSAVLTKISNVSEETLPGYATAVHGIKGSSAIIGAEDMRDAAAKLEMMAKGGDLIGVLANNAAFLKKAELIATGIKDWLDGQGKNNKTTIASA